MEIKYLIKFINTLAFMGNMDLKVKGLCYDSRQVKTGDLFVAIKGFNTDGHQFLKDALKRGACALIIEDKRIWDDLITENLVERGISLCLVSNSRLALALMADKFYGHPSKDLHLVGVTGTNGKTTTCTLISRILEATGERVGWITTLDYRIDKEAFQSQRTTPESLDLHRILYQMLNAGCEWAIVEVSSHSLALDRVAGCSFDAAILTNITQDHLDFHDTQDKYRRAKAKLFEMMENESADSSIYKLAIFNMDDPASREILELKRSRPSDRSLTITYGLLNDADVTAKDIQERVDGVKFKVVTPWGIHFITSPLMGRPNIYNILAALCLTMGFGIEIGDIQKGIQTMTGVPGRFERIMQGQNFDVIIDYAHTDDALSNLLSVVRGQTSGRVICVFGCGGDRDRTKRPLMGKAAARGSDWSILTSDNPRGEEPGRIIREIEEGFLQEESEGRYEVCIDRKEAIYCAVNMAKPGDMVVITGKGHETTQIVGSKVLPFDDRQVARQAIHDLIISNSTPRRHRGTEK
jgi:UDP-N-acetylmuramoyl-L-alanyl-D-glutamate--2,6-diaminopimelate ligase